MSDESVNAYVDGQLAEEDAEAAYLRSVGDPRFAAEIVRTRHLQELVRRAYPGVQATRHGPFRAPGTTSDRLQPLIATILLVLGMALGWSLRSEHATGGGSSARVMQSMHAVDPTKVLFHLDSGKARRMREVLDEAQNLLEVYAAEGKHAQIEIIANGDGINLLRSHHTPFAHRIQEMQARYPNLRFAACRNSLERITRNEGTAPHLVPQARIVNSGVAQIIKLQQDGWTYIHV